MQIWDTAGQERFRTITSAYYKNAQGIVVVFDLKVRKTLENVEAFWLDQIKKYAEKDVQLIIIGNKSDVPERQVSQQQLAALSLKYDVPCFMVSARSGDQVAQVFDQLGRRCIKQFGKNSSENDKHSVVEDIRKKKAEFKLKSGQQDKGKKKCC